MLALKPRRTTILMSWVASHSSSDHEEAVCTSSNISSHFMPTRPQIQHIQCYMCHTDNTLKQLCLLLLHCELILSTPKTFRNSITYTLVTGQNWLSCYDQMLMAKSTNILLSLHITKLLLLYYMHLIYKTLLLCFTVHITCVYSYACMYNILFV